MIQATFHKSPRDIDALLKHIHERTFGRLHNLNIVQLPNGRLQISGTAHSRFVGQLAEWAVLERCSSMEVELGIRVQVSSPNPLSPTHSDVPSPHSFEDQK